MITFPPRPQDPAGAGPAELVDLTKGPIGESAGSRRGRRSPRPGFLANRARFLAVETTPPAYRSPEGSVSADPSPVGARTGLVFTKALLFYVDSANQHIAALLPGSYVDPKGTKRIILDVEGAASW
jgi:hypothetical protein